MHTRNLAPDPAALVPRILRDRALDAVYQPVVGLEGGDVAGYEALARPEGWTATSNVGDLFDAARRLHLGPELDLLCIHSALAGAASVPAGTQLFVNVGVELLLAGREALEDVCDTLLWHRRSPRDVVLEIGGAPHDVARCAPRLEAWRATGLHLALDGIADPGPLAAVLGDAEAEYVKIARRLVAAAAQPAVRETIQSIVGLAAESGATVIAVGVEDEATRRLLSRLGVPLGQGYALGRPDHLPLPTPVREAARRLAIATG